MSTNGTVEFMPGDVTRTGRDGNLAINLGSGKAIVLTRRPSSNSWGVSLDNLPRDAIMVKDVTLIPPEVQLAIKCVKLAL